MTSKTKLSLYSFIFLTALAISGPVFAAPTLTTGTATQINATFATANGSLDNLGGETITQSGFVWSSSETAPTILPNAVVHLKMNDNAANTTVAGSEGGNNATSIRNTADISVAGRIGTGFTFNGSTDYVYVTDNASLDITGNMTLSAWVNTTKKDNVWRRIIDKGYNAGYVLSMVGDSSGHVRTEIQHYEADSTTNVADGSWHMVTGIYDGSYVRIYVDGQLENSTPYTGTVSANAYNLAVGMNRSTSSGNDQFFGSIDDVRVYNVALSQAQINELYNSGNGTEVIGAQLNSLGAKASTGSFSSQMSGLNPNSTYYCKAYVTNNNDVTTYGSVQNFTTNNSGYVTWLGTSSTAWSNGANWSGGTAPDSNTEVIIDGGGTAPTLDLSSGGITIKALSIGSSAPSTLTIAKGDTDTKKLTVTNDVGIGFTGVITHLANSTSPVHALNIEAANLSIAYGGKINVDNKGYASGAGPGKGANVSAVTWPGSASYGGHAGWGGSGRGEPGSPYGSLTQPTDPGSGGGYQGGSAGGAGGGVVKLTISGMLMIGGNITATGQTERSGGSGGSVYIDATTLAGTGIISANGGSATLAGGAGAGRIAIYYTTENSSISYQAYGGTGSNGTFGGAGTIYKEQSGQSNGDLIIDNNDQDNSYSDIYFGKTYLEGTYTFNTLTVQNYGTLVVESTDNISYSTLNWSTEGVIYDNGGTFDILSGGGSLTVPATARLFANTQRTYSGLTVNGTLTHSNNGADPEYAMDLTINGDCLVAGTIDVDFRGYASASGTGAGEPASFPGAGSYGGKGGNGRDGDASGSPYGSLTEPTDLGSGGGYQGGNAGGAGGGAIKLTISGTLTVSGNMTSNGKGGMQGSGSGGSIYVTANILEGTGAITANGGDNGSAGGGGGRIAMYYTTDNSSITYQAYGGAGANGHFGGAGTIYKKPSGQVGDLIIDNNDNDYTYTDINFGKTYLDGTFTFNTLTIQNYGALVVEPTDNISYSTLNWSTEGVIYDNGGTFDLLSGGGSVTISATSRLFANTRRTFSGLTVNGTLTQANNWADPQYILDLTINGDCLVAGTIDVDFKGYTSYSGPGKGAPGGSYPGSGAYGGEGGNGLDGTAGGSTYGSLTEPTDLGSGGGYQGGNAGGAGGGAIKLAVSGTLTVSGRITSNGKGGLQGSGSGGSIYLTTNILAGTGFITANGGDAGSSGGGGGRIAMYYTTDNSSITYQAYGGAATLGRFGGAGTIYKKPSGQTSGDLIINNNDKDYWDDINFGVTPISSAFTFNTLTVQNYAYLDIRPGANVSYSTLNWSTKGNIKDNGGWLDLVKNNPALTIPVSSKFMANTPRTFSGLTVSGTLTTSTNISAPQYFLNLTVNGDCLVAGSAAIDVSYRGYKATYGPGAGGSGTHASGASYGGVGGRGQTVGVVPGATYGSATQPVDLGSGGGSSPGNAGGAGGGAIRLAVSGTLTISGTINAAGQEHQNNFSGGGSGGSIWLTTNILAGTGTVTANGGDGASTGGSGSGGRIAIDYITNNSALSLTVNTGTTGANRIGNPGTIVFNREFTSVVDPGTGAGYDYNSLSAWENAINSDLTLATTKNYLHTGITGSIADGTTVTGATSAKKAELVHATSTEALVKNTRTILAGSASFISGSTAVTGLSTAFTTAIAEGEYIWNENDKTWYEISLITDATHLSLATDYAGTSGTGPIYVRRGNFTKGEKVQKDASNYFTISDNGLGAIAVAKCRTSTGVADTNPVNIEGWTASATNYIKIWTDPDESYRHHGKWDDTKYRLVTNNDWDASLIVKANNVRIDGLQVSDTDSNNPKGIQEDTGSGGDIQVSNNIIKSSGNGIHLDNIAIGSTAKIWNNLIYDFTGDGIRGYYASTLDATAYIENNTIQSDVSAQEGIYVQNIANLVIKNNLVQNGSSTIANNYLLISNSSTTSSNNISEDNSSPDNAFDGKTVAFVDEANNDFHLANTETIARNAGTNLASDSNFSFQTDIDNESRGGSWSIGADEWSGGATESEVAGGVHTVGMSLNDKMTNGLVGMWSFNGPDMRGIGVGATAYDRSGQNNHGILGGTAPIQTLGRMGQALSFNGLNSYIDAGTYNPSSSDITVSAWVYWKGANGNHHIIVAKRDQWDSTNMMWQLARNVNGYIRFETFGSQAEFVTDLPVNQWVHVVITKTNSNTYLYMDGVRTGSDSQTMSFGPRTNSHLVIGDSQVGSVEVFNGSIDEVRIYNRALSDTEVRDLYNLGNVTLNQ